jgi:mannose-6-phosphate isomerase-like protein (cupin superfamily)
MPILYRPVSHSESASQTHAARMIHYVGRYRLLRLPRKEQMVEVLAGSAWVTLGGEDIILTPGDRLHLNSGQDFVLVSSAQKNLLVLAETA